MWLSRLSTAALLLLVLVLPVLAGTMDDYHEAIQTLRCDCGCHPQSIEACACGRADQLRDIIRGQVFGSDGNEPMNAQEVIALYVAEHGEQIRIAPAAAGFNLLAWLGPLVGLVLGLLAAVALVRHLASSRQPAVADGIPGGSAPEIMPGIPSDDPYRQKLQKQLEEWE
ncbi:MAG: hypothetical protein GTN89_08500 [Acidobacteria bacterium]|nr:hypothetical protein [Acidobacteriota bacterium]NIM63953.1 hypothetical protein [Acidobacteriota bacterium]NIO59358.1 hypothetical protein [Acidobacteriota bacterium]NIQ30394.1 hypothetical protein [Acidobacteriota bacterium]NIQ85320.1 hypothetical protein [Acidobacteriota bacterium]